MGQYRDTAPDLNTMIPSVCVREKYPKDSDYMADYEIHYAIPVSEDDRRIPDECLCLSGSMIF